MRVGLISDTHGLLRPEVFDRLAGVDQILHAGDVGGPEIITDLEALAPVVAVLGNTDGLDLHGHATTSVEIELDGVRFAVAHGHRVERFDQLRERFPEARAIVHGHSHVPRADRVGDTWMLNPGSAGPGGEGWSPSVALVELNGGVLDVVHLDVATGREFRV